MEMLKHALKAMASTIAAEREELRPSHILHSMLKPKKAKQKTTTTAPPPTTDADVFHHAPTLTPMHRQLSAEEQYSHQMIISLKLMQLAEVEPPVAARALLLGRGKENEQIKGHVVLYQESRLDPIIITGVVHGLSPGKHGLTICEYGDITDGLDSAGRHWNPRCKPHGALDDPADSRHQGDLGNITANDDGIAEFVLIARPGYVDMFEAETPIGRSMVVYEKEDDCGHLEVLKPTADSPCTKKATEKKCGMECNGTCKHCKACNSYMTGNTGAAIAMGIIGTANREYIEKTLRVNLHKMSEDAQLCLEQQEEKFEVAASKLEAELKQKTREEKQSEESKKEMEQKVKHLAEIERKLEALKEPAPLIHASKGQIEKEW